MFNPVGRSLGAMVPLIHKTPSQIASASKYTRAIPQSLELITNKVGVPLQKLPPPIQPSLNARRINARTSLKHPIYQAPKRFFSTQSEKPEQLKKPEKQLYHSPTMPAGVKKFTGLGAAFYDCLHEPISTEDLNFYRKLIKPNESNLFVGPGTEKLALSLARRGLKVDLLEPSPDMRQICEAKVKREQLEVHIHPCSWKHFLSDQSEHKYNNIIVPGGETFMDTLDKSEVLEILKNALRQLVPRGRIFVDLLFPALDYPNQGEKHSTRTIVGEVKGENGALKRMDCKIEHEWVVGTWRVEQRIIKVSQDGEDLQSQEDHSTIRSYSANELIKLLMEAGFVKVEMLHFVSLPHEEERMTFVAEKAPDLFDKPISNFRF
jgi:hypothetical protein